MLIWPRGYKTFFTLNSAEDEIFSVNKYENANNSWYFYIYYQIYLLSENFPCSAMYSKKEFAIVSNVKFISRTNFMLSRVEHEKVL